MKYSGRVKYKRLWHVFASIGELSRLIESKEAALYQWKHRNPATKKRKIYTAVGLCAIEFD